MIYEYTGKPYSFRHYNCWSHAVAVRKDNNIKTKMFAPRNMSEAFKTIKSEMMQLGHGLVKVQQASDFDIVIVSRTENGTEVYHCGIYFEGSVSHCCRLFGAVRVESFDDFIKDYGVVSIWR